MLLWMAWDNFLQKRLRSNHQRDWVPQRAIRAKIWSWKGKFGYVRPILVAGPVFTLDSLFHIWDDYKVCQSDALEFNVSFVWCLVRPPYLLYHTSFRCFRRPLAYTRPIWKLSTIPFAAPSGSKVKESSNLRTKIVNVNQTFRGYSLHQWFESIWKIACVT